MRLNEFANFAPQCEHTRSVIKMFLLDGLIFVSAGAGKGEGAGAAAGEGTVAGEGSATAEGAVAGEGAAAGCGSDEEDGDLH